MCGRESSMTGRYRELEEEWEGERQEEGEEQGKKERRKNKTTASEEVLS